ncbi:FecR domain-containing protein [Fulvivirgaceae bacterium BMA12]|uniref:FecR domain-containing protein n=1 Tax=Agaribacillus aureus TaxID=3051825 RepID=A0ABT8LH74_9BACT|nr:FecR domain-containing protein [Fulvivirgaceae bacterium BMA12]
MKYEHYSESDFLKDDFFVKWVMENDPEIDLFWTEWIENHPEKRKIISSARWIIESTHYKNNYDLTSKEYINIYENILKNERDPIIPKHHDNRKPFLLAVAAVFLIFCIAFLFYHYTSESASDQLTSYTSMHTKKGEKHTFKMEDGTIVKLNAGSSIRYPKVFSKKDARIVFLEGEAFFKVAEDKSRPFIVKSTLVTTRVIGTKFNVKNNFENGNTRVALLEGEVIVTHAYSDNAMLLKPMQMVICSKEGMDKTDFDREETIGWTEKKLVFKDDSSAQVIKKLEDWYGVEIILEGDKMFDHAYTGIFINEPLENVLMGISYTVHGSFTYRINNKQVIIKKHKQK